MRDELNRRDSHLDRVEELFRDHPGEWLHARDFEIPGGRQAWRSRIAECRTKRKMYIENRQERKPTGVESWYRYLPAGAPLGPDASTPRDEKHPPKQIGLL